MPDNFEFFEGMRVIVTLPEGEDPNDYDVFNAGWDDDMFDYVGRIGTILYGPNHDHVNSGADYQIRFDDGESWWWDERYIRPADSAIAEQAPVIEESDFNDILN